MNNPTTFLCESNYEFYETENEKPKTSDVDTTNRSDRQVLKINNFYSNQSNECHKSEKISDLLSFVEKKNPSNEMLHFNENNNFNSFSKIKNKRMNSNQIKDLLKNELILVQARRKRNIKQIKISNLLNANKDS